MVTESIRKRFIAGAVCPQCQAVDKVRSFKKDGRHYRDCINCGFEEVLNSSDAGSSFMQSAIVTDRE